MTEKNDRSFAGLVEQVARTVAPPQPHRHIDSQGNRSKQRASLWILPTVAAGFIITAMFYMAPGPRVDQPTGAAPGHPRIVVEHLTIGGVSAPAQVLTPPGADVVVIDAWHPVDFHSERRDTGDAL